MFHSYFEELLSLLVCGRPSARAGKALEWSCVAAPISGALAQYSAATQLHDFFIFRNENRLLYHHCYGGARWGTGIVRDIINTLDIKSCSKPSPTSTEFVEKDIFDDSRSGVLIHSVGRSQRRTLLDSTTIQIFPSWDRTVRRKDTRIKMSCWQVTKSRRSSYWFCP